MGRQTSDISVYFSGDSGYDIHFKQIGDKYGPFDIAFMETGQYNPMWHLSHMFPEESAQGGVDLQARRYIQSIGAHSSCLLTHGMIQ